MNALKNLKSNITILIAVLTLFLSASAQPPLFPTDSASKKIAFSGLLQIDSTNAKELFVIGKKYMINRYCLGSAQNWENFNSGRKVFVEDYLHYSIEAIDVINYGHYEYPDLKFNYSLLFVCSDNLVFYKFYNVKIVSNEDIVDYKYEERPFIKLESAIYKKAYWGFLSFVFETLAEHVSKFVDYYENGVPNSEIDKVIINETD